MTTTDEILAFAAAQAGEVLAAGMAGRDDGRPAGAGITVPEAEVASFRMAAARGQGSGVVRALLALGPPARSPGQSAAGHPPSVPLFASLSGDPAWAAWVTVAAAIAGGAVSAGEAHGEELTGRPLPIWCAVFGAAIALIDQPGAAAAAAAVAAASAGIGSAAIVESSLDDRRGWSTETVAATVGAGVTAGVLLGLATPQLRAAIGICATQAAGLRAAEGTDAFPLQVGKAAFNGVEAALLARAGLTGPAEPLDGRRGLFALFRD